MVLCGNCSLSVESFTRIGPAACSQCHTVLCGRCIPSLLGASHQAFIDPATHTFSAPLCPMCHPTPGISAYRPQSGGGGGGGGMNVPLHRVNPRSRPQMVFPRGAPPVAAIVVNPVQQTTQPPPPPPFPSQLMRNIPVMGRLPRGGSETTAPPSPQTLETNGSGDVVVIDDQDIQPTGVDENSTQAQQPQRNRSKSRGRDEVKQDGASQNLSNSSSPIRSKEASSARSKKTNGKAARDQPSSVGNSRREAREASMPPPSLPENRITSSLDTSTPKRKAKPRGNSVPPSPLSQISPLKSPRSEREDSVESKSSPFGRSRKRPLQLDSNPFSLDNIEAAEDAVRKYHHFKQDFSDHFEGKAAISYSQQKLKALLEPVSALRNSESTLLPQFKELTQTDLDYAISQKTLDIQKCLKEYAKVFASCEKISKEIDEKHDLQIRELLFPDVSQFEVMRDLGPSLSSLDLEMDASLDSLVASVNKLHKKAEYSLSSFWSMADSFLQASEYFQRDSFRKGIAQQLKLIESIARQAKLLLSNVEEWRSMVISGSLNCQNVDFKLKRMDFIQQKCEACKS
jgi:hypothetical protein